HHGEAEAEHHSRHDEELGQHPPVRTRAHHSQCRITMPTKKVSAIEARISAVLALLLINGLPVGSRSCGTAAARAASTRGLARLPTPCRSPSRRLSHTLLPRKRGGAVTARTRMLQAKRSG